MNGSPAVQQTLSLDGVTRRYGDTTAVRDVSLALHPGQFTALIGASGCGKSTTLKLLAGLEAPSAGQVLLDGRDVTAHSAAARNVALMFQSYALYPHLTVYDNIAMPLRLRRLTAAQRLPGAGLVAPRVRATHAAIRAEVGRMAEMLRLSPLLGRKPGQLSGGQQQRVALARALVRAPVAFLLDEPLSNLDTQLRATMRDEIRALHRATGHPFLLVTHDQADALSMADTVAVMIDGAIVQTAAPRELYARPHTPAVAAFLGAHGMNLLPPGPGAALHPAGRSLQVGIRPEDLRIDADGACPATVTGIAFQGNETVVTLRGPGDARLLAVLPGGAPPPEPGKAVRLLAPRAALHFFDPVTQTRAAPLPAAAAS